MNVIRLEEELLILTGISAIAETYPILIKVFEKFGLVNLANIEKKAYNIYKNDSERYGNNNLYKEKTYYYDLEKKTRTTQTSTQLPMIILKIARVFI